MKSLTRRIFRKPTSEMNATEDSSLNKNQADKVNKLDFHETNKRLVTNLMGMFDTDTALKVAVGGEFEATGFLETETLKYFGLQKGSYLVDVGCGSGRLAKPLSEFLTGRYLGTDVVPELIEYARKITNRPDWRFETSDGLNIPEKDETADFVCFFSVFTHILHEQTYMYLQEAKRVLKPGGKIVFSFLDFAVPMHWQVFETNIKDIDTNSYPLNMFLSKDAIRAWAGHLELTIEGIWDGDQYFIPLSRPVKFENFENGAQMDELGRLWQSICVLRK